MTYLNVTSAEAPPGADATTTVRVGAVVVLFEPSDEQLSHLWAVLAQCAWVAVVDNSPQPIASLAFGRPADQVVWLHQGNVGGLAGGLNRGAAWLFARGVTACLLLDQDSLLPPGFVAAMAQAAARCTASGERRFILGPKVFDLNAGETLPSFTGGRFSLRPLRVGRLADHALVRCSFVINSGCMVSVEAWRQLGPWREGFMVDHVDSDYCLRAAQQRVPCFIVPWATLQHRIGKRVVRRLAGLRLGAMNHVPQRRYYLARNALALVRLHPGQPAAVALFNALTMSQVLAVLCLESDKRAKLWAMLLGLADALRGRSGPFAVWHPATAAACHPGTGRSQPSLQQPSQPSLQPPSQAPQGAAGETS